MEILNSLILLCKSIREGGWEGEQLVPACHSVEALLINSQPSLGEIAAPV